MAHAVDPARRAAGPAGDRAGTRRADPRLGRAGRRALFTIKSPNESTVPLTGLRMTIPADLVVEGAAAAPGFTLQVVRDQAGRVATLSWQGGSVPPAGLALFQFAGHRPRQQRRGEADRHPDVRRRLQQAVDFAGDRGRGRTDTSDTTARVLAGLALVMALLAIARSGRADA